MMTLEKRNIVLLLIILSINFTSAEITLSQDSLKVYNNFFSSFAGTITIRNGSQEKVLVDSMHLVIHEIDTTAWPGQIIGEGLEVSWSDYIDQSRRFYWNIEEIAEGTHRLVLRETVSDSIQPFVLNAGDTCTMFTLMIGRCLGCSGLPTGFPAFFTGRLILFFNNGEEKTIRLYSEDLRSMEYSNEPCSDFACDSSVVRQILDKNDLDTVTVQSVSSVNNGRIVQLYLTYATSLHSLPKMLTVLPASIGRLSALRILDISGNDLDSVPENISLCTDLETLYMYSNRLSTFPEWINGCTRLKRLGLGNNQLEHIPESIGALHALNDLLLGVNRLTRLPESIGTLRSLKLLDISGNLLNDLPASVVNLDSLRCLFLAGNSICSLSVDQEEWVHRVPTETNCTRPEPEWPDSQHCNAALTKIGASVHDRFRFRIHSAHAGGFVAVEIIPGDRIIRKIEVFDNKGRRVKIIKCSFGTNNSLVIRLKMKGLSVGVYYLRIVTSTSDALFRSFYVD